MARRLLAGVVVAAVLGAVGPAAAGGLPFLRAARTVDHHVAVEIAVADLRPVELSVATRRAVTVDGALVAKNVRLRETIQLPPSASTIVWWKSSHALRPGVYFVQVKAVETGGVTDCPRFMPNCLDHWSNVRRVVVRSPS